MELKTIEKSRKDFKYYNSSREEVLMKLSVDVEEGLSLSDVKERREKFGLNEFTRLKERNFFDDLKEALTEPMIIILIIAAIVSALIGETNDAVGIIGAIVIGVTIGLITEGRSKKAADTLSKLTNDIEVKIVRNGEIHQIPKSELVPGDIVMLEMGDMVPADGRLINSVNLKLREDMLTGESEDVSKKSDVIVDLEKVQAQDSIVLQDPIPAKQINMVFGGTLIAYGTGTMVVTSTGDNTEMGKIASNLSDSDEETPLQLKLGKLGGFIAKVSCVVAGILFIYMLFDELISGKLTVDTSSIIQFLKSIDPAKNAFTACVALIVAAVPEGLPTMINMTLAITMQKMAKINALVTKKEACETIGSVSIICSDKTGTLTENKMTVEVASIDGVFVDGKVEKTNSFFIENCILNSTADIENNEDEVKFLGSATECALLLFNEEKDYRKMRNESQLIGQSQFSSETKKMATLYKQRDSYILLSKGAPEIILKNCAYVQKGNQILKMTHEIRNKILLDIKKLQLKSMRILGFSYKKIDIVKNCCFEDSTEYINNLEKNMIFSGFVGIRDPLRKDVLDSINVARHAGVGVRMLTGDNIVTAKAIGEELGLMKNGMKAVEASYLETLSDDELVKEIGKISIVARSKPESKMRIVKALQKSGEVVAVTGDGINDAPALSKADVGIAMGISGTEVSKNAADIILTDDSFSTIVQGIKWGRAIYDNFQRFVQFQLTVNIIAFLVAIFSQIMGQDMPFTTTQLLWVNIIMDGPPALALGLEPVRENVLNRKPINKNASIINRKMIYCIIPNAIFISFILLFQSSFNFLSVTEMQKNTVVFALFSFCALFNAFNCREFGSDSIIPNFSKNKLMIEIILITGIVQFIFIQLFQKFFDSIALDLFTWIKVLGTSFFIIIVNEFMKFCFRIIEKR